MKSLTLDGVSQACFSLPLGLIGGDDHDDDDDISSGGGSKRR